VEHALRRPLVAWALGLVLMSCGDSPTEPLEEEPPSTEGLTLVVVGADTFVGEVATEVPISVRVEDESGAPRSGVAVKWSILEGGGAIASAIQSSSDGRGYAAAVWRLGTIAGPQRASASFVVPGSAAVVEVEAEAHASAAVAARLVADSVLLNGRGETAYLAPTFTDAYGNAAEPTEVTWASEDVGVATVAQDGLVTGRGGGTTWVTGSVGGTPDSLLVTVVLRGAITLTFDDGRRTAYTEAFPVVREYGFVANVAVNPGTVSFPANMGLAHLQELHEAGWSMVSHGMNHLNLTTLTPGELDYELRAAKEFLDEQGFRGTDIFVVPYHDWTDRERLAVSRYYRAARGITANFFPTDSLVYWMPSQPFDLTGMAADYLPYTTVEGRDRLRALLQRTVDEGRFVDLFFHEVPPENVPALRETLAILGEFRDRVLPYAALYPAYARTVR